MVNYKHQIQSITINFNGLVVPFNPAKQKLIHLYLTPIVGWKSMELVSTTTDYLVPAGRQARIVLFVTSSLNFAADELAYSETADSSSGTTTLYLYPPAITITHPTFSDIIPANNYINLKESVTTIKMDFWVLEEDA